MWRGGIISVRWTPDCDNREQNESISYTREFNRHEEVLMPGFAAASEPRQPHSLELTRHQNFFLQLGKKDVLRIDAYMTRIKRVFEA